ncbi:CAF17-like 4Fe-4S cluster assembly/insertion protein YgfZ [Candidatus Uabimicrobium amorphum]|uniref:Folate-binding protein YgfZ n=1 Tax=Uabimicrobium amorphum TaxID=2596890 RepID=A0A5S9IUE7_UABAM|nr:hypothetical protein [Candidatus Uabimicrobium amorphum]BBM87826.1 folate-binding protein YgfZ [Candidatus Uabimicrobium amorphum]
MSDFAKYLNKTTNTNNAVVYNLQHLCILEVAGKDAISFLQRMTTNNIMAMDESITTIFANDKGRILDSVRVVKFGDKLLLICHDVHNDKLISWIEKYTILDDVTLNKTDNYFLWQVWNHSLPNSDEVKAFHTAEKFVQIVGLQECQQKLVEDFRDAGVQYCDNDVYEHDRVTNAIPIAPNEINDTVNPHEVNLIAYVDFDKGCYVGQEVIARLDTYDKVQKYLYRFSCSAKDITSGLDIYTSEGKKAGSVTSISHLCETSVGLALVRKKFLEEPQFFVGEDQKKITLLTQ